MRVLILLFIFAFGLVSPNAYASSIPAYETVIGVDADNNTIIRANMKQARFLMDKGDYVNALSCIEKVLAVSPNHSDALSLKSICQQKVLAQQKEIERKEDANAWETAKRSNTIEAYHHYLNTSKTKAYKEEAEQAINELYAEKDWARIQNSYSVDTLKAFISHYKNTSFAQSASYRFNVLKAEDCYNRNIPQSAISYYEKAKKIAPLEGTANNHYNELLLDNEYETIKNSSDLETLTAYMRKIDSSNKHYRDLSNHMALVKAQQLNGYSTESEYNSALYYAKDTYTRRCVEQYIEQAKKSKRSIRRQHLSWAHGQWWKRNFKVGIEGDAELSTNSDDIYNVFFSTGMVFRFGCYEDAFNMVIGAKYRWFAVEQSYDSGFYGSDSEWYSMGGAISVPLSLRFNIAELSTQSRLFFGIGGEYGIKMYDSKYHCLDDSFISVSPQLGITSPHFDISLYWKTYVKSPYLEEVTDNTSELKCNSLFGMHMGIFF